MTRRTKTELEAAQNNMKGRKLIEAVWQKIHEDGANPYSVATELCISYPYLTMLRRATVGASMDKLPVKTLRNMAKYLNISLIKAMLMADAITEIEASARE